MGLVLERMPATLELAGVALAISVLLALPFGVLTVVWRDTPFDSLGKVSALLGQSLPSFWLGIVLMWIFAVSLGWLPTSGRGGLRHMILPAVCLGWFQVGTLMRLTRSVMLDVLDSEFVKLTRIKGLPEWKVVWKRRSPTACALRLSPRCPIG
jgi:peptide/nickel transport system permease protein